MDRIDGKRGNSWGETLENVILPQITLLGKDYTRCWGCKPPWLCRSLSQPGSGLCLTQLRVHLLPLPLAPILPRSTGAARSA